VQGGTDFARVGVRPVCARELRGAVRGVLERVVGARPVAGFDLTDFGPDGKRSISASGSLSVGSTMSVLATGKLSVGAWKP